jgi:hypothetical protein
VIFLDSDDIFATAEALELLLKLRQTSGAQVVIGSCAKLLPDGTIADFDRDHDRKMNGRPGNVFAGEGALRGSLYLPGASYLPVRSWGVLIDRDFLVGLDLRFPATEHEDLAHTPFMFFKANQVYYDEKVIVHYRVRENQLSRAPWVAAKLQRYVALCRDIREKLHRFGLAELGDDIAVKMADHLLWKIGENGLAADAETEFVSSLTTILTDIRELREIGIVEQFVDSLLRVRFLSDVNLALSLDCARLLPTDNLLAYFDNRVRKDFHRLPESSNSTLSATRATHPHGPKVDVGSAIEFSGIIDLLSSEVTTRHTRFEANEHEQRNILALYEREASTVARELPAMLTTGDRAVYFYAARTATLSGAIVDAGCFVGGTTANIICGALINPVVKAMPVKAQSLIKVYDLFTVEDGYIREHLEREYPNKDFSKTNSFLDVFKKNVEGFEHLIDVRPGNIMSYGYPDRADIEVLGVDCCKALPITDFVIREFFTRLIKGGIVLQQDFVHEFHPYIHLSMLRLWDHFKTLVELRWGGAVAFVLQKPITPQVVQARFGGSSNWYREKEINVKLLQGLAEASLYDENRWTYLLTLSIYLASQGDLKTAQSLFYDTVARYPQFQVNKNVLNILEISQC